MTVTCSIDPGLTGGVAIFDGDEVVVHDMPVIADRAGGKKSIDVDGVLELIKSYDDIKIVIEVQGAMPKQGVASTFQTGLNYGRLLGMLDAMAYEYEKVSPRKWTKAIGKPAKTGKEWHVAEARRRWPHLIDVLLKSKDGRADALLIGAYALGAEPAPAPEPEQEPVALPNW